jgi:hypothetical protein
LIGTRHAVMLRDSRIRLVLATVLIGIALQINNGFYSGFALAVLIASAVSAAASLHPRPFAQANTLSGAIVAALAIDLLLFATMPVGLYLAAPEPRDHPEFLALLAAAAVIVILIWRDRWRAAILWFPLLLITAAAMGAWMINASPTPHIDVVTVHKIAIAALRAGQDPYAVTFPNIYGDSQFYAPEQTSGGQVLFGFPYPPLSLFMASLGQILAGDIRYAELAAFLIGAALIGYAPRTPSAPSLGPLAAALLLFTPRSLFVLEQAWTDTLAIVWLGGTLFAACRAPRLLPWMLALLVSIKQHLLVAAPLGLLMLPPPFQRHAAIRFLLPSLVVPAVLAAPFLLINAEAFPNSVVLLQLREPFRQDSLSLMAWLANTGWPIGRDSVLMIAAPLVAVTAVFAIAWRSAPRTPAGFALSLGLTLLVLFAFSKKAFCNYYFLVIACFCAAVAVYPTRAPEPPS